MNPAAIRWTLVGGWMAVNITLSHQPHLPGPSIPYQDKILHALSYGLFAWLLARAWAPGLARRPRRERLALVITICLLWGVGDEIHQSFIPGRSADPLDVLADVVGAGLVAALTSGSKMKS